MNNHKLIELNEVLKKQVEENLKLVYEKGFADGKASADKPKFKTEKRVAEVGERILVVDAIDEKDDYKDGGVFIVNDVLISGVSVIDFSTFLWHEEYEVIIEENETIEHNGLLLRKVEREAREGDYVKFAELSDDYRTHTKNNKLYEVHKGKTYKTDDEENLLVYGWQSVCPNPEVFEVVNQVESLPIIEEQDDSPLVHVEPVAKTPNEQRAALIERAKEFVEKYRQSNSVVSNDLGYTTEFEVDGITVSATVYLIDINGKIPVPINVGISKCMPGEVFNKYIGKAIALARALKIDVSEEFLRAVYPTEKVVGMVVDAEGDIRKISIDYILGKTCHLKSESGMFGIIIDDTNAKYV